MAVFGDNEVQPMRALWLQVLTAIVPADQPCLADSSGPELASYYDRQLAIIDGAAFGWTGANQPQLMLDGVKQVGVTDNSAVAAVISQSERSARNVTTALSKEGIIFSPGPRDNWQIAFPAKLAPRLMPGLFP